LPADFAVVGRIRVLFAVVLFSSLAGCTASWAQFHAGPDRVGNQPNETKIGVGNVGTLTQARKYPANGTPTAPIVANGVLYVATNTLYAFDATGATHCASSPTTCTPLWTAPAAYAEGVAVANGFVYVTEGQYGGVNAFDAAGSENCGGTPKTCKPIWTSYVNGGSGVVGYPAVVNGIVYVGGTGDGAKLSTGGAYVMAFDAAGSKNCVAGVTAVCSPLWTTTGAPVSALGATDSPTVANGRLYVGTNTTLLAFDANGSANCAGAPKVCSPLWSATTGGGLYSSPSVAGSTVFIGGWDGKLYAYSADGSTNCSGTPKTCTPLWTASASTSIGSTAAVVNGVAYIMSVNGKLSAFDATGSTNCSGAPKTCTPLWTSATSAGYASSSSPAVANGVVYFTGADGTLNAIDAGGTKDCAGSPKVCSDLWSANTGYVSSGSPAVVDGVVYTNVSGNGVVYAYSL
jgi:serine/threonine-protein kinase